MSTEQYLCDQIRKVTSQLEGVKAKPMEADGPSRQQVQD